MLDKRQIEAIFLLKFKMGHKAAETICNINHAFGKELQFTSLTYISASTSEASEYICTVSMIFTGCSQPMNEHRKTKFYKMQDSSHWWCWLKDSIFPLGQNFLTAVLHRGYSCVSSFLPFLHCSTHISSCSIAYPASSSFLRFSPHK